jgi:hypothetical protein
MAEPPNTAESRHSMLKERWGSSEAAAARYIPLIPKSHMFQDTTRGIMQRPLIKGSPTYE